MEGKANIDMNVVAKNRKLIGTLGSTLGGKYFTIGAQETHLDFEKKKREIEMNNSLDFITNRSPRRFIVRDHDVVSQTIETGADGTTKVVFNPGTDEEAKAAVVAGIENFGATTEDAISDALHGQKRIFANGTALVSKANEYNEAERQRLIALRNQINAQITALESTMKANSEKVNNYEQEILNSTPKVMVEKSGSSASIVIEPASAE